MAREVIIVQDADALALRAADIFEQVVTDAIKQRGRAVVALSGGSTPERLYNILATRNLDWPNLWCFLGDERMVPAEDPASNYGMIAGTLVSPSNGASGQIHPVNTLLPTGDEAAKDYEKRLADFFGNDALRFDLILLGLGDDGHTASLFPGAPSLDVEDRWVVASPPGILPPPVERVTFTYPVLNAARNILFLVAGEKKAPAVHSILETNVTCQARPAACVQPTDGRLIWLLDKGAASQLNCE